ncbi:GNAT family N-acetyltransferase [Microvirga rosea]|uniref:GNAT family N-acetyltransferase n=1 Tax=Microvirga rosea TaxID=2715425 RepID=UPI001D0B603F|nr:GNAT family N-acetyltransferase [Microvirga rosea]MCB8823438.1 GNAT family N-acetyltransferase [Microvirga rosea]
MNDDPITIRAAGVVDAEAIGQVVLSALRSSNAKDYTPEIIARVAESFSPAGMATLMARCEVLVAVEGPRIVGTASLDGKVVRTVFVAPDCQGKGVGAALMRELDRLARAKGNTTLAVPSSVTAEGFYAKLGFKAVRDSYHGDERTIIMERSL